MKSTRNRSVHKSIWKTIYIICFDHIEFVPLDDKGRLCFPYKQKQHSNLTKLLCLNNSQKKEESGLPKREAKVDLLDELQNISTNNYDNNLIDDNDF